ncbi:hypothetical protein LEP1GSC178_1458 [Leptospira licerasiae str. MMD4847]|uniref:Uncharacterized protein n=1 Tax=Leptospira licerasiae str. MMD4847 TaxID=1049971 RepID=A0ABN0H6W9_9LEPT|nr:hypothetical protein LEP1GSC178_1458 [Leptospira licerasiae str. MMD4847]
MRSLIPFFKVTFLTLDSNVVRISEKMSSLAKASKFIRMQKVKNKKLKREMTDLERYSHITNKISLKSYAVQKIPGKNPAGFCRGEL